MSLLLCLTKIGLLQAQLIAATTTQTYVFELAACWHMMTHSVKKTKQGWVLRCPNHNDFKSMPWRSAIAMESQTLSSKRAPQELQVGGLLCQPFANPSPTLRQPFANLLPTFRQPFLSAFSTNPSPSCSFRGPRASPSCSFRGPQARVWKRGLTACWYRISHDFSAIRSCSISETSQGP